MACERDGVKGAVARYDPRQDAFLFHHPDDGSDEPDVFGGQEETIEGVRYKLYSVGGWSWVWTEAE